MDKFEKLKTIIEREYEKKKSDLEKHGFKYGIKKISLYRKEGWRDCLEYLLSEISLIENIYQYKDKGDNGNVKNKLSK